MFTINEGTGKIKFVIFPLKFNNYSDNQNLKENYR